MRRNSSKFRTFIRFFLKEIWEFLEEVICGLNLLREMDREVIEVSSAEIRDKIYCSKSQMVATRNGTAVDYAVFICSFIGYIASDTTLELVCNNVNLTYTVIPTLSHQCGTKFIGFSTFPSSF